MVEQTTPSRYKALNDATRLAHADLTGASPNPEASPQQEHYHLYWRVLPAGRDWEAKIPGGILVIHQLRSDRFRWWMDGHVYLDGVAASLPKAKKAARDAYRAS